MRPGAARLEAAEIVAAQEEPVDDLLLVAQIEEVARAGGERDAPIAVPGETVERQVIGAVELGADELRVAAQPGEIRPEPRDEAGMRIDRAVAIVERERLPNLRQQRIPD